MTDSKVGAAGTDQSTPRAEFLAALADCDTPTLANAVERLGLRPRTAGFVDTTVRKLAGPSRPMVGFALTVEIDSTGPELATPGHLDRLFDALDAAPRPSVLVIAELGPDPLRGCHAGEIVATGARARGCVGLVSDSGIRDVEAIGDLGLHAFARGRIASHGTLAIGAIGGPVEVAGMPVSAGDLIHGDPDGVITVPAEAPADLLAAIDAVRAHERDFLARLANAPSGGAEAGR